MSRHKDGPPLRHQAESGSPEVRIIMTTPPANYDDNIRVNLAGINLGEARTRATAMLSLLSEGETFCDECGEWIDELAVYVTHPRRCYEVVAIVHRECFTEELL